ncbi:helix-turn-helix domain-containing protein [Chryseobacterium sp. CCH4-E10]|uniref:helix-turn-helix domain-containing protein n=1 Tax=Chryseobacterium sp. CCH4-E10 TaxID=1768758 RepID=UPI00083197BF|nr:AraC family transcriptional regulator [Chryseobacterium sp. CCH4-E10]
MGERKFLELKLKNLISKSGLKLINFYFREMEGIDIYSARLGEVSLYYDENKYSYNEIKMIFEEEFGFEVIHNPELQIIEKIKIAVIELIFFANNMNSLIRNSDYISQKLQLPYDKLTRIFSAITGKTLEQYILMVKIEKIKSLLLQEEYTVSEISYMMGYSTVQYLSNQFKKSTGKTISEYKKDRQPKPVPLEEIL